MFLVFWFFNSPVGSIPVHLLGTARAGRVAGGGVGWTDHPLTLWIVPAQRAEVFWSTGGSPGVLLWWYRLSCVELDRQHLSQGQEEAGQTDKEGHLCPGLSPGQR